MKFQIRMWENDISQRVGNVNNIQADDPILFFISIGNEMFLTFPSHPIRPMKSGPRNMPTTQRRAA